MLHCLLMDILVKGFGFHSQSQTMHDGSTSEGSEEVMSSKKKSIMNDSFWIY